MAEYRNPYTTVVLAMSADGKLLMSSARLPGFPHQLIKYTWKTNCSSDAVLFGPDSPRLQYHIRHLIPTAATTISAKLPPQPVQLASRQANIDPQLRFFRQSVPGGC